MRPKKHLGQHFLRSSSIAELIVSSLNIERKDTILEIGPGEGVLTEKILNKGPKKLIGIEKDPDMVQKLQTLFKKEAEKGQFELINKDILEYSPQKLGEYKLVGNIPYYITGKIIEKFLTAKKQPQIMIFMVQKEVAERIVAKNGKESILSISVKAFGEPKIIRIVKSGSFYPPPTVDSAILKITSVSKDFLKNLPEEAFFKVVKAGFAHKRKTLIKNLTMFKKKEELEKIFDSMHIPPQERAENLKIETWKALAKTLSA